jgi:hypothetical protein
VRWPPSNDAAQLFVPVYVPEIAVFEIPAAVPLIVALQPGNPDIPPDGTVMMNVSDVPESVPATVPSKATMPRGVLALT